MKTVNTQRPITPKAGKPATVTVHTFCMLSYGV